MRIINCCGLLYTEKTYLSTIIEKEKAMKVLMLGTKEYPRLKKSSEQVPSGGIETYLENLMGPLVSRGYSPLVITRHFRGLKRHEIKDGVEVYRVPFIHGFYLRNPTFNSFAFLLALFLRYDIIHAHGPIASFFGGILKLLRRKPMVATPHGVSAINVTYPKIIRKVLTIIGGFGYRRADEVIYLTQKEKENFRKYLGLRGGRIILSGVNIVTQPPRDAKNELGLPPETLVVGYIGRLISWKNVDVLVEAVPGVVERAPGVKFFIAGDGPQREELKEKVRELGVQESVMFLGFRSDVPRILSATDIFVHPSVSDIEGLPLALLEGMAGNCALITTYRGLPIEEERLGIPVRENDSGSLVEAILKLVENPELRKEFVENALRYVKKHHTWDSVAEKSIEVYDELYNS